MATMNTMNTIREECFYPKIRQFGPRRTVFRACLQQFPTAAQITFWVTTTFPGMSCGHMHIAVSDG